MTTSPRPAPPAEQQQQQLEEEEVLVPHQELPNGTQPMEVVPAETAATVENQPIEDPPISRFTWTIENLSRVNTKKLYSEIFVVGGYKWRILIFPGGNNVEHLSMYLDVADSGVLPYGWTRYAQFSLSVVNQIHNKFTIRKETQHQFSARESDWGFTSFMPLSELYNPNRGYLVNDTCIVEAWSYDSKKETVYVGLKNQAAPADAPAAEPTETSPAAAPTAPTSSSDTVSEEPSSSDEESPLAVADPPPFAHLFDFDISHYLGGEADSVERKQSLSQDIHDKLATLLPFLDRPIERLVENAGSIRVLFTQLEQTLPGDLADALNAAAYIESHRLRVHKAKERLSARKEQLKASDSVEAQRAQALAEKQRLDALKSKPVELQNRLEHLEKEEADLEVALRAKREEIWATRRELEQLPEAIDRQEAVTASAVRQTVQMAKALKPISGTVEDDLAIIDEADAIRRRALELLHKYLD